MVQAELDALKQMFESDGWRVLMREVTDELEGLKLRALAALDERQLYEIKGQFAQLQNLYSLEDSIVAQEREQASEELDDADLSV